MPFIAKALAHKHIHVYRIFCSSVCPPAFHWKNSYGPYELRGSLIEVSNQENVFVIFTEEKKPFKLDNISKKLHNPVNIHRKINWDHIFNIREHTESQVKLSYIYYRNKIGHIRENRSQNCVVVEK